MISEDVQHAIFHWTTHRAVVEIVAGVILSPEIIVNHMLASETTCWVVKMKNYESGPQYAEEGGASKESGK